MPLKRLREVGTGVKLHRDVIRMPKQKVVYHLVRWYRVTVVDDLVEDGVDEEVSDGVAEEAQSHDEDMIIEAMQEALDEDTRPAFPIIERTKFKK